MALLEKTLITIRSRRPGQTMTEYVLILAAVAIAGYAAYVALEGGINDLITTVTTALKSA